jgi:hypothetical protein
VYTCLHGQLKKINTDCFDRDICSTVFCFLNVWLIWCLGTIGEANS